MAETVQEAAREARGWFVLQEREGGESYWTLVDAGKNAPNLRDAVRAAHVEGEILPDDYIYSVFVDALDRIEEADDADDAAHEFADDVDVYTSDLLRWVSSHLRRVGYCDEYMEQYGADNERGLPGLLMGGQYMERAHVYACALHYCQAQVEERV